MTPSGTRGVLNDALSIYFADASLASATLWPGGACGQKWRQPVVCSKCVRIERAVINPALALSRALARHKRLNWETRHIRDYLNPTRP
jgi:hypothetical protein